MHRMTKLLMLAAALTLASAASAAAQVPEGPLMAQAIDSDAPTARIAREVADLVLAGDRGTLETYLKQHSAPAYASAPSFAADLTALLDGIKTGPRTVVRLDGLGRVGVGVALATSAGDQPQRAIVVALEPDAPHRILGLRLVPISGGPGE